MYEAYFGFHIKPFSVLPDADFLYRSKGHRRALSLLEYGLGAQTGFTVVTGEIGSGKTTLVQFLLKHSDPSHTIGYITNTIELNKDLMRWVLDAFNLSVPPGDGVDQYRAFVDFVEGRYAKGLDCVLIIDEAQLLDARTLESIRLLSNINLGRHHALKIMLIGQPELLETLSRPDLVQFAQRISAKFHLKPLDLLESREYIRTRLRIAGGAESLFDDKTADLIYLFSGGIPRLINIMCDTALVYAYADGRTTVDIRTIVEVLLDRASGRHVGALPVPKDFDEIAAEQMVRSARERELVDADASEREMDRKTLSEVDDVVRIPSQSEVDPNDGRERMSVRKPSAPPLESTHLRTQSEFQRFLPSHERRTYLGTTTSREIQDDRTDEQSLQEMPNTRGVSSEQHDIQLGLFENSSKNTRRSNYGRESRESPVAQGTSVIAGKPFEILPLIAPARNAYPAESAIGAGSGVERKVRGRSIFLRRSFWIVVVALVVASAVLYAKWRGLA